MPEHPVKQKLNREILPYLVSSKHLWKQWFYWTHFVFGYTTDLLVALTAIGLSSPLFSLLSSEPVGADPSAKQPALGEIFESLPENLYYPIVILLIAWTILRVAFSWENGQKRAVLARSCRQTLKQVESRLHQILLKPDPMPHLNKILDEVVFPTVDRNVQEGSWPWSGPAPNIDQEVEALLASLTAKYGTAWVTTDVPDLRRAA